MFENSYICTKKFYKEYYRGIYFKKPIMIILNIILIISFVINMLSIIFPQLSSIDNYIIQTSIASALIIICIEIYAYNKNVYLSYNKDLERNKGNAIEIKMVITEDSIDIINDIGRNTNIEFKNIEKVIKTKNYYILVSKAKLGISVKKDSFVKGTLKEFEELLKQKKLI